MKQKKVNIIFRGSESFKDWYYDLNIFKICLNNNVYIHGGFYKQLTKNNNHIKIINIVKDIVKENEEYDIYLSGHSLGGALCTIMGYLLSKELILNNYNNKIIIISFGSPRIGNYSWRIDFDNCKNIEKYRVVYDNDIVTALPFINYYHVGTVIRLSDLKTEIIKSYNYNKYYDFSIFKCYSINNHYCNIYYKCL